MVNEKLLKKDLQFWFKDMKRDIFDTLVYNELHYPISIMFLGENQNVINMITKKKYWHKPTYKTFEVALIE